MFVQNVVILDYTVVELFDSLAGRTRFTQFVQYLIAICSRLEAARVTSYQGSFVGPMVVDKQVKCRDPRVNLSR